MKDLRSIPIVASKLNLTNSVGDIFKIFKHPIRSKGLRVTFERLGTADKDIYVYTDTIRTKQIILNLVGNAVKYTETGFVKVSADVSQKGFFKLVIEDSGIGIPSRELKHLTHRYFRASNTGTIEGSGIGLRTVATIVTSLGGTIGISSIEGVGTTVTVTLPDKAEELANAGQKE